VPNRLAGETSPYLLQHQDNPVDWYPWGEEALQRARQEDRPIFLSIGYSACHWCHVMEHESFENEEIAGLLNERFVCIKVDREERPDLDQIYMQAVQMMTGHGGWPMSIFLTPELKPFYGGTYWPPHAQRGMPGFDQIVQAVDEAWKNRREQALEGSQELARRIVENSAAAGPAPLPEDVLASAAANLEGAFDFKNGGFGGAPKFPHPMDLQVLLRYWAKQPRDGVMQMVRLTLDRMAAGGIYDHLGGGFARYSVDARWLVPHFEKMLYDNALLLSAYLEGFVATGEADYARVARETADYVLRDMTDPGGGFYSTEDADSEGEEGKFYVWTPDELRDVLGPQAAETFAHVYDVSEEGNFEGRNILNLSKTIPQCAQLLGRDETELRDELADSRAKLLAARNRRVRPGRDDKVLVSWNGLMIDGLSRAANVLDEPRYRDAARAAADFLLRELRTGEGRLLHTWRRGTAKLPAYLDDYAALANALVSVYETTFDESYIDEAVGLADQMLLHFADPDGAGFFYTADDHEALIARTKDLFDSSVPSASALAATALSRLGMLCGRREYLDAAETTIQSAAIIIKRAPTAAGQMLLAADMLQGPTPQIAILTEPDHPSTVAALAALRRHFIPNKVLAVRGTSTETRTPYLDPLFDGKQLGDRSPTVFICRDFACQSPVTGLEAAEAAWQELSASEE